MLRGSCSVQNYPLGRSIASDQASAVVREGARRSYLRQGWLSNVKATEMFPYVDVRRSNLATGRTFRPSARRRRAGKRSLHALFEETLRRVFRRMLARPRTATSLTNTIPLGPGRATATSHRSVRLRRRRTPQPVFDLQPIRRARAGPFAWHCHSVLHGRHGSSNFYGISDQESVAPLQDSCHLRTHFHGTPQCTYIRRSCEAQVLMPGYRSRCSALAERLLARDARGGTSSASFATIFL